MKPSKFTKNEHLILSSRISNLFRSIKICPWQFFTEVRIIFDIYFQLNLFLEVSLIFWEKLCLFCVFKQVLYIVSCLPKKDNLGKVPTSKSFVLEKSLSLSTSFFLSGQKKFSKKEQNHKFLHKSPRSNGEVAEFSENDLLYYIN